MIISIKRYFQKQTTPYLSQVSFSLGVNVNVGSILAAEEILRDRLDVGQALWYVSICWISLLSYSPHVNTKS